MRYIDQVIICVCLLGIGFGFGYIVHKSITGFDQIQCQTKEKMIAEQCEKVCDSIDLKKVCDDAVERHFAKPATIDLDEPIETFPDNNISNSITLENPTPMPLNDVTECDFNEKTEEWECNL